MLARSLRAARLAVLTSRKPTNYHKPMRTITGRKYGKQASSLFAKRHGKHHGRRFTEPTPGMQEKILIIN